MRTVIIAFALAAGVPSTGAATVFNATAADAAGLQPTVDAFRDALGELNPPAPVNAPGGRRQINWDAAPAAIADPNPFPGDFFNGPSAPRARGIEFRATGDTTGFLLSSDPADDGAGQPAAPEFGFDSGFTPFSPNRLFSPVGGTTFDVLFFDPADQTTPAGTTGLGVVFIRTQPLDDGHSRKTDLLDAAFLDKAADQSFTRLYRLGVPVQPVLHLPGGFAREHLVAVDLAQRGKMFVSCGRTLRSLKTDRLSNTCQKLTKSRTPTLNGGFSTLPHSTPIRALCRGNRRALTTMVWAALADTESRGA